MSQAPLAKAGQPVLAVDVGNSRTKYGLFVCSVGGSSSESEYLHSISQQNHADVPFKQIQNWLQDVLQSKIRISDWQCVIAGTKPAGIEQLLNTWPGDWPQPILISNTNQVPLALNIDHPDRVGIDRVLNACAADRIRQRNQPACIVDSGTAMTIDVVSAEGVFEGGAILPGFEMSARALHNYTALLPLISVPDLKNAPDNAIGRETRSALLSGLYWGQVGAIREIVQHMLNKTGFELSQCCFILTGGGAGVLQDQFPSAIWQPHLTLQGLLLASRTLSATAAKED